VDPLELEPAEFRAAGATVGQGLRTPRSVPQAKGRANALFHGKDRGIRVGAAAVNKSKERMTGQLAALGVLVSCFLLSPPTAYALAEGTCEDRPAVKAWIRQGNDPNSPFEKRRAAFEQAVATCPSDLNLYNGFAVLLLKYREFDLALHWIRRGLQVAPSSPDLKLNLSVALLSTGQTNEALTILKRLPSEPKNEFYLGMAYRNQGDHQAARRALERAFAQGYEDPYVLYALIEQERVLGDKEAGLEHFRIFYQRFPNSPFLHLLLGDAYLFKDNKEDAENEYRQALGLDPGLPVVNFRLGYVEFKKARYTEAEDFFRKEIELSPAFAESYLYLGACLHRLGQNDAAILFLQQAITRNPHSRLAYRELATVQLETNHADTTVQLLKTAVKLFPDDQSLRAQLAQLLTKLGQLEEARQEAHSAQRLSARGARQEQATLESLPSVSGHAATGEDLAKQESRPPSTSIPNQGSSGPEALGGTGAGQATASGLTRQGRDSPALDRVRGCLARADDHCAVEALSEVRDQELRRTPDFLELQARTLTLQHKYSDALEAIKLAIQEDSHQVRYLLVEGELYQRIGEQLSAVQAFLQAHELDPRSPVPIYSIGMSFFALGFYNNDSTYYDRAARHFRQSLELDPRFSKAEFMLGVIDVVKFALKDAKPHYEKAIQLDPENAYYHLHYGVLLSRLGDNSQALHEIGLAGQLDPSYALTHFSLGNLHSRLGQYEEARDELETAAKLDPHLASAFYSLGDVYRHLGLKDMAQKAFETFESVKQQESVPDPVEATISSTDPPKETVHP